MEQTAEHETEQDEVVDVPRVRHRARAVLIGLLVLCLVALGAALYLRHRLTSQIGRIEGAFAGLDDRPPLSPAAHGAMNILVVGTDVPDDGQDALPWVTGTQRPETILLLHLDGDRRGASAISIPRDSWVPVPGHGTDTIGTAFSDAAPSLAVETVESLTGVRIDHLAVIEWAAFDELIDSVGGITLGNWATDDERHVDGAEAIDYLRQRTGRPGDELDRVARQQEVLRVLMEDALHAEMRHSPFKVYGFLSTVAGGLSLDEEWSANDLTGLVFSLRNLRTAEIAYLTAPVADAGTEGGRSVVHLDPARGAELWDAVRDDDVDAWVAAVG